MDSHNLASTPLLRRRDTDFATLAAGIAAMLWLRPKLCLIHT
ncbi:hypothetical protein [Rhizobium binae]|nr:hypothetical protein [Rhizobium binae]